MEITGKAIKKLKTHSGFSDPDAYRREAAGAWGLDNTMSNQLGAPNKHLVPAFNSFMGGEDRIRLPTVPVKCITASPMRGPRGQLEVTDVTRDTTARVVINGIENLAISTLYIDDDINLDLILDLGELRPKMEDSKKIPNLRSGKKFKKDLNQFQNLTANSDEEISEKTKEEEKKKEHPLLKNLKGEARRKMLKILKNKIEKKSNNVIDRKKFIKFMRYINTLLLIMIGTVEERYIWYIHGGVQSARYAGAHDLIEPQKYFSFDISNPTRPEWYDVREFPLYQHMPVGIKCSQTGDMDIQLLSRESTNIIFRSNSIKGSIGMKILYQIAHGKLGFICPTKPNPNCATWIISYGKPTAKSFEGAIMTEMGKADRQARWIEILETLSKNPELVNPSLLTLFERLAYGSNEEEEEERKDTKTTEKEPNIEVKPLGHFK